MCQDSTRFPMEFRAPARKGERTFSAVDGYCAVQLKSLSRTPLDEEVQRIDEHIAMCRGEVSALMKKYPDAEVTPLYREGKLGAPGVPTGRIFLRLDENHAIRDQEQLLRDLGFRLETVNDAIPNAGWITRLDNDRVQALMQMDRLSSVESLESAEPQLIRPSQRKRL